jgi:hypothetical protein
VSHAHNSGERTGQEKKGGNGGTRCLLKRPRRGRKRGVFPWGASCNGGERGVSGRAGGGRHWQGHGRGGGGSRSAN